MLYFAPLSAKLGKIPTSVTLLATAKLEVPSYAVSTDYIKAHNVMFKPSLHASTTRSSSGSYLTFGASSLLNRPLSAEAVSSSGHDKELLSRGFKDHDSSGNWTTRGLPTRGLDDSRTGQLADWTTRGLADAAKKEN